MIEIPIYMDNQSTTRVDPRVVEAMLPYFGTVYGNAGSSSHPFGRAARQAVDESREQISAAIGARPKEVFFTSGATESNNLALCGAAAGYAAKGRHLIASATEHPSVLEPLERLRRRRFEVTLLPVIQSPSPLAGRIDPEQVAEAIRPDTILVSVMLVNNEIGVIQPVAEIGRLCRERGVLLHCDATQAAGKIPVDIEQLEVDLLSFSAHKLYGPKGIGALYVRRRPAVRIEPIITGGGQEHGLRSGTLNVPGIVGFARALEICIQEMPEESRRIRLLRDGLAEGLMRAIPEVTLNGPALQPRELRLAGNLNVGFARIDGEALMLKMQDVAISAGSACTSADPVPSHVLRALGLSDDAVRGSVRFGLGRFNTQEEVQYILDLADEAVRCLRSMADSA